mmetsp:Transcript_123710/g.309203  ORF Transcript_123710/g.309203 Transcript_123710/m.309203 type:complete len:512 (+) Transcript_123710:84-1619(+)
MTDLAGGHTGGQGSTTADAGALGLVACAPPAALAGEGAALGSPSRGFAAPARGRGGGGCAQGDLLSELLALHLEPVARDFQDELRQPTALLVHAVEELGLVDERGDVVVLDVHQLVELRLLRGRLPEAAVRGPRVRGLGVVLSEVRVPELQHLQGLGLLGLLLFPGVPAVARVGLRPGAVLPLVGHVGEEPEELSLVGAARQPLQQGLVEPRRALEEGLAELRQDLGVRLVGRLLVDRGRLGDVARGGEAAGPHGVERPLEVRDRFLGLARRRRVLLGGALLCGRRWKLRLLLLIFLFLRLVVCLATHGEGLQPWELQAAGELPEILGHRFGRLLGGTSRLAVDVAQGQIEGLGAADALEVQLEGLRREPRHALQATLGVHLAGELPQLVHDVPPERSACCCEHGLVSPEAPPPREHHHVAELVFHPELPQPCADRLCICCASADGGAASSACSFAGSAWQLPSRRELGQILLAGALGGGAAARVEPGQSLGQDVGGLREAGEAHLLRLGR